MATIEFDSDDASEVIYQKVKGGTLKGVSVGYLVDDWEEVMPNKTSTDGRFMGPCSIAKKWAPYEISIVSVPADPTVGVGRELEEKSEPGTQDIPLEVYERQLQINKNFMGQNDHSIQGVNRGGSSDRNLLRRTSSGYRRRQRNLVMRSEHR